MATNHKPDQVRTAVRKAIKDLGGPSKTAELLDVSRQTVHTWLRTGHIPKAQDAVKLALALSVPVEDLIG